MAGVRVDSAALPAKDPLLPDLVEGPGPHLNVDRHELHDVYRAWRAIADEYGAVFVGEVWLPDAERFARYLRPDELYRAFNFSFMTCPWDAARLRTSIDETLAEHAPVGAPATWVLCNHYVTRTVTRYGRSDTGFDFATKAFGTPTDLALGTRRARAAALLSLALPGTVYLYQGEELGLPEVEVDREHIQDPMHARSGGTDPGRDGCRVPRPWAAKEPYAGFGSRETPWLPQPDGWAAYAVDRQQDDPGSMLTLYRRAIRLRPAFGTGPLTSAPPPPTASWPSNAPTARGCWSTSPTPRPTCPSTPGSSSPAGPRHRGAAAEGHGRLAAYVDTRPPRPRCPMDLLSPRTAVPAPFLWAEQGVSLLSHTPRTALGALVTVTRPRGGDTHSVRGPSPGGRFPARLGHWVRPRGDGEALNHHSGGAGAPLTGTVPSVTRSHDHVNPDGPRRRKPGSRPSHDRVTPPLCTLPGKQLTTPTTKGSAHEQ
ncbi:hypothetical protein SHIRM173S_09845 [Streptomyces hirsutus]